LLSALRTYRYEAPCKQVGLPAYREEPHIVDGTADRPADALIIGLELVDVPTVSEICADVLVVGSTADSYLAKGATLAPGAALATGSSRKLRNVQKLASNRMILVPLVASSGGGFHSAWALLYEKLAERWQLRGEGRDGDDAKAMIGARWWAESSTTLQRCQYSVIMGLVRLCARVEPASGTTPHNWRPLEFEDVLPYRPGAAH
jgi:hypothetical protein